eukprot:TRINITY_DN2046_c0_g1_i1.p1 TRINITY_DN2046_c0_g1~~TRINITY_DN2046_c0_g1_i1.p1  ORF type:complete len:196 (-),score=22.78 TRINITY_DN2046_c0_g1_i1:287-874(-)
MQIKLTLFALATFCVVLAVGVDREYWVNSNSPCSTTKSAKEMIREAADAVYNQRAHETYTQDATKRWIGIHDKVCPPAAPSHSDCSSAATWIWWTAIGQGADILNGESWKAGYTGTLKTHGSKIDCSKCELGDIALYTKPAHAAVCIGNQHVVSHGHDPAEIVSIHYRSDLEQCRRYMNLATGEMYTNTSVIIDP